MAAPAADEKEKQEDLFPLNTEVTRDEVKKTKALYSVQCTGLTDKQEQKDLWKTLTIAMKNKIPLLPWIIDSFVRDRLNYYMKYQKPLNLNEWGAKYETLKTICKEKKDRGTVEAAAKLFFHRYSAFLQLPVAEKYDDSIEDFTNHIIASTNFIHTILDNDSISPPFQVDMLVIPRKVVGDGGADDDSDEEDSDDFDDDDSDEDEDSDDDAKKDAYDPYGEIPDVQQKLDSIKVCYEHTTLQAGRIQGRNIHTVFTALKSKVEKMDKENNTMNKPGIHATANEQRRFSMPHRNRLCVVADRRKGEQNELFIYKPPVRGDVPPNQLPEWYFQSSFQCVIPGNQANDTITAKTSAKGYVFCLSFQVETRDSIKLYLYTRSQMIRFFPKDVATLLPELFVMGQSNKSFIENEKKTGTHAEKIKLRDIEFEKFRARTKKRKKKKAT